MKHSKLLIIIFALVAAIGLIGAGVCACTPAVTPDYTIELSSDKNFIVKVGDKIDYSEYFIITDKNGNRIMLTEDMLDLTHEDTSKGGSFEVTITVGDVSKTATFVVVPKQGGDIPDIPDIPDDPTDDPTDDLTAFYTILASYADESTWNFAITLTVSDGADAIEDYYEYRGLNILNSYLADDGKQYTDYLGYDAKTDTYSFYSDNGDDTYDVYAENTDDFEESLYYLYLLNLSALKDLTFVADGDKFVATNPSEAGDTVICEYEGNTWVEFAIYVADDKLSKIVGVMDDGYTETYVFSKHGAVNFVLPEGNAGGGTPDNPIEPTDTMEKQTYDPSTFDGSNLQDRMLANDGSIGLPSTGNISALVIPVQFKGDTITSAQLADLETAFNGTSEATGWESVKTYYQKASYGNLNLSFDIQSVYQAQNTSSYYASYSNRVTDGGYTYDRTGEEVILLEALAYYENKLDLTKYDTNGDGCIDAVYLIYSAPVDYYDADFYWAYVTWYYGDREFDNVYPYYYLFAGIDFMYESTSKDVGSGYSKIPGLKINADTYIHETGHLLGLDDYYDYDETKGCNEGLGGADMMDYNVGDQNVYSKIMLGWLKPTVVNETKTVTIESSCTSGSAILIPLNFNNSYFSEYLLIDLYAAQGLNALHARNAQTSNARLYGGADHGVRMYHVSSSITTPYDNEFASFTEYNNSLTDIALIKLVEADGERNFASSQGSASATDLWKTGDTLSRAFPSYTRNDGKKVNFDISIVSVSASSATITVTFN